MDGIKNLLSWLNDNWAAVVTIAGLSYALYLKIRKTVRDWKSKTEEEKQACLNEQIEKAKAALANYILSMVSRAEIEWNSEGEKMGKTKRADVLRKIYEKYPCLEEVADQEELLAYIDSLISKALETVRETMRPIASQE